MAKEQIIKFTIDGLEHQVTVKGLKKIQIDDNPVEKIKYSYFTGEFDFEFDMNGHQCIVTKRGKIVDLAVNGKYVNSSKDYEPIVPVPGWAWVFVVLNCLIPVVSLGGALPAVMGVGGAWICAGGIARNEKFNIAVKVVLCILITALMWALLLGLLYTSGKFQAINP